jgi:hypothetical protein
MLRRGLNMLLRRSLESVFQVTAESAATATTKSFIQVFEVDLPITVYVRASHSDVTVRRVPGTRVELSANLRASFGWDLAADQDSAGVYIVAKRKRVVGAMSSARFTLTVPPEANLVLNLTPGTLHIENVDGKLNIPGAEGAPLLKG